MIQKLRIASLIGVHVLILAHIYIFGDKVIGSLDFQEFFHSFIKYGIINSGVLLVLLAFFTTLIFGRFFCGWACHFGAIQEFSWWILNKINIKPKTINSSLVTILPLFILINFYIAPNLIYAFSKPWQGIIVKLENPGIWEFLPGFIIGLLTFIIDGFMIVYFLGRKGFCRFLCPWGAFLKFPNSLAMFKVRNTGACIQSGNCTNNCPVGIDVSYEINNYDKVTNANCTSCLICTEGCQANAISYKWKNPFNEDFKLKYYSTNNQNMYRIESIKNNFIGIHAYDYFILILILLFGFSIDGLYGMGHFLSFGIATIFSIQVFFLWKNKINKYIKYFITCFIVLSFFWHGLIKFSIWNGLNLYKNNDYLNAIIHLERAVIMYPKSIGRFHIILSQMYLDNDNLIKAKYHALKALSINPDHNAPVELLNIINGKGD